MGKKIFVSYKYSDWQVQNINGNHHTKVRDYVDVLDNLIEAEDHIYKGEDDGEDMSSLADTTIGSKLGDKIFDSSLTIVLISKGMKSDLPEKEQWIPWEVSYSLKEQSREGGRSKTNALLAVVLPDETGHYDYYIRENTCSFCNCRTLMTNFLFKILRDNMFNKIDPELVECENHSGRMPHKGYSSYIYTVRWDFLIKDVDKYINIALKIRENINQYDITKKLT